MEPFRERQRARRASRDRAARSVHRAGAAAVRGRARQRLRLAGVLRRRACADAGPAGARCRAEPAPASTRRCISGRGNSALLEAERDLFDNRFGDGLCLRLLEDHPGDGAPSRAAAVRGRDRARRPLSRPEMTPPWNWGTSPLKSRRSVDLPPPEGPGEESELAWARSSSETSFSAGAVDRGIRVGDGVEVGEAHSGDLPAYVFRARFGAGIERGLKHQDESAARQADAIRRQPRMRRTRAWAGRRRGCT